MNARTPAKTKINKPFTLHPCGTFIYKLFDKKYRRVSILGFDTEKGYYTVRYNTNDKEELTPEDVKSYLNPPKKGEYWTENQSSRQRSKRIENLPFTQGYAIAVRALNPSWCNLHKQSTQEYKHFANTVIFEETGRRLEYRHLIKHPKC